MEEGIEGIRFISEHGQRRNKDIGYSNHQHRAQNFLLFVESPQNTGKTLGIMEQFKDTKHPNQPESTDYQQIPCRAEEPAYIKRQSRQQVNNTEKT